MTDMDNLTKSRICWAVAYIFVAVIVGLLAIIWCTHVCDVSSLRIKYEERLVEKEKAIEDLKRSFEKEKNLMKSNLLVRDKELKTLRERERNATIRLAEMEKTVEDQKRSYEKEKDLNRMMADQLKTYNKEYHPINERQNQAGEDQSKQKAEKGNSISDLATKINN